MITSIVVGLLIGTIWAWFWIHLYDIRQTQKRVKWMREQNDLIDLIRENNAFDRMTRQMARHRVSFPRAERFLAETEHLVRPNIVEQDKEIK